MPSLKVLIADGQAGDRVTSAGSTLVDAPVATEALPRWLTLGEATFLTGIEEDELQAWVISGSLRCDRSLSRRLGEHYLLVLREDLVARGLLEMPGEQLAAEEAAQPSVQEPEPPAPAVVESAAPPPSESIAIRVPPRISLQAVRPTIHQVYQWTVVGVLSGLLLAAALPLTFGYRTFPVRAASMVPALHSGDLMVARAVPARNVRVGDVVALTDPADGREVAARVRQVETSSGKLRLETQTDAGRTVRRWAVPLTGSVLVVRYRVAVLGAFASRLPRGEMRFVPYALPVLVLVALALYALHMRRRHPPAVAAA